jgi:hypothetical protein
MSFCKNRTGSLVKQVLFGGWYKCVYFRGEIRKGCKMVNMVEILCIIYENGTVRPVETAPGMRGGGIKENDGGGEFNYDICL